MGGGEQRTTAAHLASACPSATVRRMLHILPLLVMSHAQYEPWPTRQPSAEQVTRVHLVRRQPRVRLLSGDHPVQDDAQAVHVKAEVNFAAGEHLCIM